MSITILTTQISTGSEMSEVLAWKRPSPYSPGPQEHLVMRQDGFDIPDVFYRADTRGTPRAFTSLEDGHNVLTHDDPGQSSQLCLPLAGDGLHLQLGEEKEVTPVVSHLDTTPSAWPSPSGP
jgi:hypothetical protein